MNTMYPNMYWVEETVSAVIPALFSAIPSGLFSIAAYVLTSIALYTLAKRRGISKAWLSWVPVVNVWVLGSLSDQYRYVVKGQYKSKRKSLLVLSILMWIFSIALLTAAGFMVAGGVSGAMRGLDEDAIFKGIMGPALAMLGLCLPLVGVSIALMIIRYMALYDVYTSMDPANNVLFLVLSILVSFTEPFFLFFSRSKDQGMPPRKQAPVYTQPQEPVYTRYEEPVYNRPQEPVWQAEAEAQQEAYRDEQ